MNCWSEHVKQMTSCMAALLTKGKRQKTKPVQCASESKTKMDGSRYSAKYLGKYKYKYKSTQRPLSPTTPNDLLVRRE